MKWQKEIAQRYSRYTLEPNFLEMKDTFRLLFRDEKSKILGKTLLKNAGFSDSELRKHLNFSKSTIARANHKVANAKSVLPDMWKTAFRMVRSRYPGRSDKNLLPRAKLVMKKLGAGDVLSRERTQLARRPRIDIDVQILETIVETSATSSDSGLLTHAKRHYDVKYLASVKESVEINQKLSAGSLREQYNLIARETEMPTASVSTLKRCLAPHSGHKNSQHYSNLREYTTINSTDAKVPVTLGSKNSFDVGRTWLSYVNEDDRWNPLHEKDESDVEGCKRGRAVEGKVVPLQALGTMS